MRPFRLHHLVSLALAITAFVASAAPPTVQDQSATMFENATLTVAAPGVLTGAADIDADPFTAFLVDATAGFTVQINTNGAYIYTPPAGFVGTNCFTFAATDGVETSTTATVCVVVTGPIANDDEYATLQEEELRVPAPGVLANDTNSLTGALTALLVVPPVHGTVELNPDGSFGYAPDADFNSFGGFFILPDSFQYMATDGSATSAVRTVFIVVEPLDGVGDVVLGVSAIQFRQLRNQSNRDRFSISGHVNPRGADTDLSNATMTLELNDIPLGEPVQLDAKGRGASVTGSNIQIRAAFNSATGKFTIRLNNLTLDPVFGISNVTAFGVVTVPFVKVKITGANLDIPAFTGFFQIPYATLAGRYSFGRYKARRNLAFSGEFSSLRTQATQVGPNFTVSCIGTIARKNGAALRSENDVLLTIGQEVIRLPVALVASNTEISVKSRQVPELTSFALSTRRQAFRFQTQPIANTGIPLTTDPATRFELPVRLEISTNFVSTVLTNFIDGSITNVITNTVSTVVPTTFRTTIELKRPDSQSPKWSR